MPLACCCVSADGEKLYGCVPTKYDYLLPLYLHTCLCPQQGGNPCPSRYVDEDKLCLAHCVWFLVNNTCLGCIQHGPRNLRVHLEGYNTQE